MNARFTTINELESALNEEILKGLGPKDLNNFARNNISDLMPLIKSGIKAEHYKEGYFCSGCGGELTEEESGWTYCNCCLSIFDCCESEEPCDKCYERAESLVKEIYKTLINKRLH